MSRGEFGLCLGYLKPFNFRMGILTVVFLIFDFELECILIKEQNYHFHFQLLAFFNFFLSDKGLFEAPRSP